jgi:hypothetical protein
MHGGNMAKDNSRKNRALPEIPDFPDSPLAAWKHYGILKALERRFHQELEAQNYTGHLVGLDVTYLVGKESFTMEYGYGVEQSNGPRDKGDPLSDDFVAEMYDLASDLISEHIDPAVITFDLSLGAAINQPVNTVAVKCQIATDANCGKDECEGKCRKFISRNNGPWTCTHKKGKCKCS